MNLRWYGDTLFSGKWKVARITWNGLKPKGSDLPNYVLVTFLPGIRMVSPNAFNKKSDAKESAERVVRYWFDAC